MSSNAILPKNRLHGQVIEYSQLKKVVPKRKEFLDINEYKKVENTINKGKPLIFMPNDVIECTMKENNGMYDGNKYAKGYYKIIITGVCVDGRKITVMLDGIKPYFYVKVPKKYSIGDTKRVIRDILERQSPPVRYDDISDKRAKEFKYNSMANYVKLTFRTLGYRNNAMYHLSKKFEMAHNDRNNYFRVFARDHKKTFTAWITLSNYKHISYGNEFYGRKIFKLSHRDYKTYKGPVTNELQRDKLIELSWDIETFSKVPTGTVPLPEVKSDNMFMIGISVQWYYTPINTDIDGNRIHENLDGELLNVLLVDTPTAAHPNKLTIICDTEKNIIKAMAIVFNKIRPDFVSGFNDSAYDWKWYATRAYKYGLLKYLEGKMSAVKVYPPKGKLYNIDKYKHYEHHSLKYEAKTNIESYTLKYLGYINVDARTQFRLLYKTAGNAGSLKYFLEVSKLGSKADMPYTKLFKIYRYSKIIVPKLKIAQVLLNTLSVDTVLYILNVLLVDKIDTNNMFKDKSCDDLIKREEISSNENIMEALNKSSIDMADAGEYCFVDALRCHELLKRRELIIKKRNFADLTYTTIGDGFIYADGMKIRNLLISRGQNRGYYFDNGSGYRPIEGKFPGAYVGFPDKGLICSKLSLDERIMLSKSTKVAIVDATIATGVVNVAINKIESEHVNKHILWKCISKKNVDCQKAFIGIHGIYYEDLSEDGKIELNKLLSQFDDRKHDLDADPYSDTDTNIIKVQHVQSIHHLTGIHCRSIASICLMDFLLEKNKYPVTSFDFKSLYPNIIITYNLSPEYLIKDRAQALKLQSEGKNLQYVSFTVGGISIKGWFVRHDNNDDDMGLFPSVLKEVQEKRDVMKLPKNMYEHISEVMSQKSINSMSLYDLIMQTYEYVNHSRPQDKLISRQDIITKYLHLNMDDIMRTNSV